jgi:hypothetical protein|tara:strand:- start:272 stop:556 length:285 start_codon:yes stop_codon:yes gene_type:complete
MDFAYDLIEKLDEETSVDYMILVVRKGSNQDKVDLFYKFDAESKKTLKLVKETIDAIVLEDGSSEKKQKAKPANKKSGKPAAKKKRGRPPKKKE